MGLMEFQWKPHYYNTVAGCLYGITLWIWIDACVLGGMDGSDVYNSTMYTYTSEGKAEPYDTYVFAPNANADATTNAGFYLPIILSTIVMILVNTISNSKITQEDTACQARALITVTYVVLFGSLAAAIWITAAHHGDGMYPYIANIIVVFLIIAS